MARHECCREIETAIFAARTNLPVLDFQTWQVWATPNGKHVHMLQRRTDYIRNENQSVITIIITFSLSNQRA